MHILILNEKIMKGKIIVLLKYNLTLEQTGIADLCFALLLVGVPIKISNSKSSQGLLCIWTGFMCEAYPVFNCHEPKAQVTSDLFK